MTEPMSTPDSGGLREGLAELVVEWDREGWPLSADAGRRLRALLAAHPEPVPTPDSADDATVGERKVTHQRRHNRCGLGDSAICGHPDCPDVPATSPADDANRAPVSGGLDEGERRAILSRVPLAQRRDDDEIIACVEHVLAARDAAWVERLAAVEGERDHAKASQAETWRYVCEIAQTLGIEPDDGHPMDVVDRMTARAEAAEAERDTARREAGERIAVAKRDAWEEGFDAGERDVMEHEGMGWRDDHPCIPNPYRADALTSDDGSGA